MKHSVASRTKSIAILFAEKGRVISVLAQTGFLLQIVGEPRAQRIHLIPQVRVANVENGLFHGRSDHDEVVVDVVAKLDLVGCAQQIDQNLKAPAPDTGVDVAQVRIHLLHGEYHRLVQLRDRALIIGLGLLPEDPQLWLPGRTRRAPGEIRIARPRRPAAADPDWPA